MGQTARTPQLGQAMSSSPNLPERTPRPNSKISGLAADLTVCDYCNTQPAVRRRCRRHPASQRCCIALRRPSARSPRPCRPVAAESIRSAEVCGNPVAHDHSIYTQAQNCYRQTLAGPNYYLISFNSLKKKRSTKTFVWSVNNSSFTWKIVRQNRETDSWPLLRVYDKYNINISNTGYNSLHIIIVIIVVVVVVIIIFFVGKKVTHRYYSSVDVDGRIRQMYANVVVYKPFFIHKIREKGPYFNYKLPVTF